MRAQPSQLAVLFLACPAAAFVIQPATRPQQISAAAALCVDCFVDLRFPQLQRRRASEEWESALAARQQGGSHALLVATSAEGELLGCVECGMLPPPPEMKLPGAPPAPPREAGAPPPSDVPYLANLAVVPASRGRGLGQALVQATEELARERWGSERLFIKVDRNNFDARRLYDRRGYELAFLQSKPADWRNAQSAFLFLRKDLATAAGGAAKAAAARARPPAMLFDGLFGAPKRAPRPATPSREASEAMASDLGVQLPSYEVLRSADGWEVRRYQPLSVVECEYTRRPEGYELLGGYAQRGENAAGLAMPSTAPCLMRPLGAPKTMWYILPSPHTPLDPSAEPVPAPAPVADDVLTCKGVGALTVAVGGFSGYAVPDVVLGRRAELARDMAAAGIALADGAEERMLLAQYNELFALPWNRDNEVWLEVEL